jgi:hypothetical protein
MYISHKYKFIFLRTPKTASSSLSEFFIKNIPDPSAVYTPVEDSNLDGTLNPGIIQKYEHDHKFYHFTLQDLIYENIITEFQARTYKSFAVLRDPIDRQKSFYYFYKKWKNRARLPSLREYKKWTPNGTFVKEPNSAIRQTDFLSLNGKIIGDYWLYENLNAELNNFMKSLDLNVIHPLPKHKTNFRKNRDNEIQFDEEDLKKLQIVFESDFKLYNELKEKAHETN